MKKRYSENEKGKKSVFLNTKFSEWVKVGGGSSLGLFRKSRKSKELELLLLKPLVPLEQLVLKLVVPLLLFCFFS